MIYLCFVAVASLLPAQDKTTVRVLDACEDTTLWRTFQSAGVIVSQHRDIGESGGAIRVDVAFTKGSGYGGIVRTFDIPLPENYELSFSLRATVPLNNFEVKLSNDTLGENIWWVNKKNYAYPSQWKRVHVKKRHLSFAWGPRSAPAPDALRRLELVVTAGSGGKGSVWIDDLRIESLPMPPSQLPRPTVKASTSAGKDYPPESVLPGSKGAWVSRTSGREWIEVDFKYRREIGGVLLRWDKALSGLEYELFGSLDGIVYDTLHAIQNGKGGSVLVFTPESEIRFLRVSLRSNQSNIRYRLEELSAVPSESLSTINQYVEHLAAAAPSGRFPRYFSHQQSYWTIVGVPSGENEALFNEDGAFEVDKQRFSIEPFIFLDQGAKLSTWIDCHQEQSLEKDYLPLPTVKRSYPNVVLTTSLLATGEPKQASILARYTLRNVSRERNKGSFFLVIRPYQVNPTSQSLNFEGGVARIDSMSIKGNRAIVGDKSVTVSGSPSSTGVTNIDAGEIVEYLARGTTPVNSRIMDPVGLASGAFAYQFDLLPNDSLVVVAAVPFQQSADRWERTNPTASEFEEALVDARSMWERVLNTVKFSVPPEAQRYVDVLRSNLGYILINKDGPGFQPGSRSYERSWIRDGSMTSSALLKLGLQKHVRQFVEWYSSYQYENGMVPCVVDKRGPDPVPENDSEGQLIFACMEYFRFSKDTVFLRARWPNLVGAVNYIQQLRAPRLTPEYANGDSERRAFYGLVTESISHEGYSSKPMHSYWDDFFTLKGLRDAAEAAWVLGKANAASAYDSLAGAFRKNLYESISLAMKNRKIDYIPGCVELGDFDPTSTSIALFPCGECRHLPQAALNRTYDKYYSWFEERQSGKIPWEAYTPYEIRNVGSYVYLGQKERAHNLLEWFMQYQRPSGWNHWAEVVWRDERMARFIGDMPHTWVGSDFINALRAMFVYEMDDDRTLVVGAGLKDEWVRQGLSVEGLPIPGGTLTYSVAFTNPSRVILHIEGALDYREISLLVPVNLVSQPLKAAMVNGLAVSPIDGFIKIAGVPATVELVY
ncbi:MAG: discoidin domain-containing protein [Ignavibacteriales bacterium]|nr:discoidin domain-containing protein [Ignavibacteriales bacterium]